MSNFANLPISVGLPSELVVGNIDPTMPPEAKSQNIRVYALNNPTITTTCQVGPVVASQPLPDIQFPQTDVTFDFPCSQSKSHFLDTRMTSINFRAVFTVKTEGTGIISRANIRSSAYSFFSQLKINSQSGGLLEHIPEYGLTCDTIMQGQMSQSDREGMHMLGVRSNYAGMNNIGKEIHVLTNGATANVGTTVLTANDTCSMNFTIPLVSGVLGVTADKFFPIGLTRKLLLTLTTDNILPVTLLGHSTTVGAGPSFTVSLTDFWLNAEIIDIGANAFNQIASTLPDGKMYLHGQTYKTTTALIPTGASGVMNLPVGLTGSSVRSLFARFHESAGTPLVTTSLWGKYSSSNPTISSVAWNIGGTQVPSSSYNPLLHPSQTFRSYLQALGSFNSTQFKSSICGTYYTRLFSGGLSSGRTSTTQDQGWDVGGSITYQNSFFIAENLETIPRRGLLSGQDLTFQKVHLALTTDRTSSHPVNVYIHALMDCITIVDVASGECITII